MHRKILEEIYHMLIVFILNSRIKTNFNCLTFLVFFLMFFTEYVILNSFKIRKEYLKKSKLCT